MSNIEYLDFVEEKFKNCFTSKGYYEEKPVKITSQVDPTVDFIGSKISPLKKYIIDNNIKDEGIFLLQNSMKLKALKRLHDDEMQTFGSYYKCMGTLTKPNIKNIVEDTFEYFLSDEYLNMNPKNVCIRINSGDEDLVESIEGVDKDVQRLYNTVSEKHYKHQYGMDNITGRDFNIGIKNIKTGDYFNCATVVMMENEGEKIGVDMGIGNCSLSMCNFGLSSTIESSRMGDIIKIDNIAKLKYADALIAVSTLLQEDITNHPSKHFRKKFRQYLNALIYWKNLVDISDEETIKYANKYIELEYKEKFIVDKEEMKRILKKQ